MVKTAASNQSIYTQLSVYVAVQGEVVAEVRKTLYFRLKRPYRPLALKGSRQE